MHANRQTIHKLDFYTAYGIEIIDVNSNKYLLTEGNQEISILTNSVKVNLGFRAIWPDKKP